MKNQSKEFENHVIVEILEMIMDAPARTQRRWLIWMFAAIIFSIIVN